MSARHTLGSEYLGHESPSEGLGMNEFARRIAKDIKNGDLSVVGIFGRWGMGKTHLLNQIGRQLAGEDETFKVCCFRAWEYEAEGNLACSLIRALISTSNYPFNLEGVEIPRSFFPDRENALKLAWELCQIAIDLAADALPFGAKAARRAVNALLEARSAERMREPVPSVDQFRAKIGKLINAIAGDKGRLFVLIDDLDRCAPPHMVRLFDWFKNHLAAPDCTYVLGLDHRMAAMAVAGHYKDYVVREPHYGYHYLHKLFERDYEIQPSPLTHQMAMKRLKMEGADIVAWTKGVLGRDFPGERDMRGYLGVPSLWVPRLMIRGLDTYKLALKALEERARSDPSLLQNDLAPSHPCWLLIISILHHLLPTDRVESFVGALGTDEVQPRGALLGHSGDPWSDLVEFLNKMKLPSLPHAQNTYLYRLVREKTPRSLREAQN